MVERTHDFEGPVHVLGQSREGWGYDCRCGYRSPLYQTREATMTAMHEHQASPPPVKRASFFGGGRRRQVERRHGAFAVRAR